MNENYMAKEMVKEDPTIKTVDDIVKAILSYSISDQNAIFSRVREYLAKSRMSHIEEEKSKLKQHAEEVGFAEETLHSVILSELK